MFLFALLAIHQQQLPDLNQKVTLDMRAVQGVTLMRELSRKTGISFEAHNAAATDRYLVTVRDVPLKQLMDKLAEAETGVWQHFGDNEFQLVRDRKNIEKEQRDERENTIKRIAKAFEKYRKDLGTMAEFGPDKADAVASTFDDLRTSANGGFDFRGFQNRVYAVASQLPIGRFLEKVILGFTPEQLADLPERTRTVYAVNPTAMQHPLPADATDAITELAKEQQYWEEALAKHLPTLAGHLGISGMNTRGRGAQICDAMLDFHKRDEGSDIEIELTLLGGGGHVLCFSAMEIQPPPDPPRPPDKPTPSPNAEPPIPLSPADIEMAMLFKKTDGQGSNIRSAVSGSIRRVIATPTKFDPLNTFATDIIEGFAASHNQNIVAVLDDRIPQFLAGGVTEKGFDPRRIERVTLAGAERLVDGPGFFVMREQRPDRSDKINCNRVSLEDMIAGSIAAGRLTVKLAADFAAPLEQFDKNTIPYAYLAGLFGQDGANALNKNDPDLLRFYGMLDGVQRNGNRVFLGGITSEAGELLNRLVYDDNNYLDPHLPPPTPEELRVPFSRQVDANYPTIALGQGIPTRSSVTIDSVSDREIATHAQWNGLDQGDRLFDPKTLASILMEYEDNVPGWRVVSMAAADQDTVKFGFEFTDTVTMDLELSSFKTTSKETTSPNELPDDLRRPLLAALSEERKSRQGAGGGRSSNNGPP
jgi:hypothetical protein